MDNKLSIMKKFRPINMIYLKINQSSTLKRLKYSRLPCSPCQLNPVNSFAWTASTSKYIKNISSILPPFESQTLPIQLIPSHKSFGNTILAS